MRIKISPFIKELIRDTLPVRMLYRRMIARSPYLINLELTTRCNLSCRMCSRPRWLAERGDFKIEDMPREVLGRVLDGIGELRQKDLIFMTNGLGEPLLYPGFITVIEEARRRAPDIKFSITTNAVNLNRDMAAALIKARVDNLTVSVNAPDRESYAELMGADLYGKIVDNVLDFIRTRKELARERPFLSLQFLETSLTKAGKKDFHNFWMPKLGANDKIFVHEPVCHAGSVHVGDLSPRKRGPAVKYPCSQCWSRLAIRLNGDVYPCDAAYYAYGRIPELFLGNVLETPLKEIYFAKNSRVNKIRQCQLAGDYSGLGPCGSCDTFRLAPNAFFHVPFVSKKFWA